jgi:hypothetical protein
MEVAEGVKIASVRLFLPSGSAYSANRLQANSAVLSFEELLSVEIMSLGLGKD